MKKVNYISDLHFEHVAWIKELSFQRGELKSFQNRLEEVVPNYTSTEVLSKVEQFQNKFIRHNEVIDTLEHEVNEHEHNLVSFAKSHPIAIDHVHFKDHTGIREKVESQLDIYKELKKKFMRFLTQTM